MLHRKRPKYKQRVIRFSLWTTSNPISVNSCIVNGVRFVAHNCDEHRTTQNNGICSPGEKDKEMYYGQLEEILEFLYMAFKVVLFRVKWFNTSNEGRKIKCFVIRNNITQILASSELFKDQQYILATQDKQVFYLEDMARRPLHWKVIQYVNHNKFSNGCVIVVEDDRDVIHFNNSSDLALSTSLNDLDFATLNIDGQSTNIKAPPDIIDVYEDVDFIDDEDGVPHDLSYSDDEVLTNDDDDDVVVVCSTVARGHDGDGSGDDPSRPPLRPIRTGSTRCTTLSGIKSRRKKGGGLGMAHDWDKQIDYWLDPKNATRSAQNAQNWAKSKEEMIRQKDLGANTPTGRTCTEDQIMAMVQKGKQRGHILGVGRVLARQGRGTISINEPRTTYTDVDVDEIKQGNKRGSGSGGGGDDEPARMRTPAGMRRFRTCYIWVAAEKLPHVCRDMSPGKVAHVAGKVSSPNLYP
nr:hypothetical protein [Tanacetum cinerariifolium]